MSNHSSAEISMPSVLLSNRVTRSSKRTVARSYIEEPSSKLRKSPKKTNKGASAVVENHGNLTSDKAEVEKDDSENNNDAIPQVNIQQVANNGQEIIGVPNSMDQLAQYANELNKVMSSASLNIANENKINHQPAKDHTSQDNPIDLTRSLTNQNGRADMQDRADKRLASFQGEFLDFISFASNSAANVNLGSKSIWPVIEFLISDNSTSTSCFARSPRDYLFDTRSVSFTNQPTSSFVNKFTNFKEENLVLNMKIMVHGNVALKRFYTETSCLHSFCGKDLVHLLSCDFINLNFSKLQPGVRDSSEYLSLSSFIAGLKLDCTFRRLFLGQEYKILSTFVNDLEEFCQTNTVYVPALVDTIKHFYYMLCPMRVPDVQLGEYLSSVIPSLLFTDKGLGREIMQASETARYLHVEGLIARDQKERSRSNSPCPPSPNPKPKSPLRTSSSKTPVDLRHLENTCLNFLKYGKCDLPIGHRTKSGIVLEHHAEFSTRSLEDQTKIRQFFDNNCSNFKTVKPDSVIEKNIPSSQEIHQSCGSFMSQLEHSNGASQNVLLRLKASRNTCLIDLSDRRHFFSTLSELFLVKQQGSRHPLPQSDQKPIQNKSALVVVLTRNK